MEPTNIKIRQISFNNRKEIERFLRNAGSSLEHFRYFNSRPLEIIQNHHVTLLAYVDIEPIGYAHLDLEDGVTWLGIAISDKYKRKGIGKRLMKELIFWAKKNGIAEIRLSVDNNNLSAQNLYHLFGFKQIKRNETVSFFTLRNI